MNWKNGLTPEMNAVRAWWMRHEEQRFFYPVLLALFCLAALLPLWAVGGIPIGHDLPFHLARIDDLANGLKAGIFPVKIYGGVAETGYANGLFYPDAFLYIPAALRAAGMSLGVAYKIFFSLLFVGAAGTMYGMVRKISGDRFAAFAAGLLYVISSYAVCDFWIRAALGEMQSFVFLPLVLWGLFEILRGNPRHFLPLVIGMTGLALAHVITLILATLLIAILSAFHIFRLLKAPGRIAALAVSGMLTLLLTAYFFLPLLEMMRSDVFYVTTSVAMSPIATRTVPLTHLFLELPYMKLAYWHPAGLGMIFVIILFYRLRARFQDSELRRWQDVMLLAGVAMALACTSFLPWEGMFSKLETIQFPWRLYLPALSCLACGGALAVARLSADDRNQKFRWLVGLVIACSFAFCLNAGYIYAAKISEKQLYTGTPLPAISHITCGHYLPSGTDIAKLPLVNPKQARLLSGQALLEPLIRQNGVTRLAFRKNPEDTPTVEFPLIAYKGYQVLLNGKTQLPWQSGPSHFVTVQLPRGIDAGQLQINYQGTRLQHRSLRLSLGGLVLAILIGIYECRRNRKS